MYKMILSVVVLLALCCPCPASAKTLTEEIKAMRDEIANLKAENARLVKENERLTAELDDAKAGKPVDPTKVKKTWKVAGDTLTQGMTRAAAEKAMTKMVLRDEVESSGGSRQRYMQGDQTKPTMVYATLEFDGNGRLVEVTTRTELP